PEPGTLLLLGTGLASVLALRRRKSVWALAARVTTLAVTFLCLAGPAAAQNSWQGLHPVNVLDFWSNAGEWSLGTVPDGSTDITIGFDTVGGDTSFTNRHTLTIGGPATLNLFSTTTVTNSGFGGFIVNGGSLISNGTLVNASSAALSNGGTLTNNGTLFNEIGAQLNSSGVLDNFGTFSNRISGFVVNTGNLYNESGAFLTNDLSSTIENDHSMANEAGATLTNSGRINGSGIFVNFGTVDNFGQLSTVLFNLGGTINNTGGSIRLGDGSDIVGGSLGGPGGNVILSGTGATATLDGSNSIGFGALTIKGTYTGDVETTTNVLGTINNLGNIQVNGGGSLDTHLSLLGNTTLQGGGTVTLADLGGPGQLLIRTGAGGATLTNVDNTIQGTGQFFGVTIVNQSGGTFLAGPGQTLSLDIPEAGTGLVNAGLLEATNGGALFVGNSSLDHSSTADNTGGRIVADGGAVSINHLDFLGGTITAANGGTAEVFDSTVKGATFTANSGGNLKLSFATIVGGSLINAGGTMGANGSSGFITLDGSTGFGAVTIQGSFAAPSGADLNVLGTIINQGNISLLGSGTSQFTETTLKLLADTIFQGGGTISLVPVAGQNNPLIAGSGTLTLTNLDNTIQGAGLINSNLVNLPGGTVNANVAGDSIQINGNVTNRGLLEATNGSALVLPFDFNRIAVIDNHVGTIAGDGGSIPLNQRQIIGGTLEVLNGGVVKMSDTTFTGVTLNNAGGTLENTDRFGVILDGASHNGPVTLQGTFLADPTSNTYLLGTINNQGNFQMNGGNGSNAALFVNSDTILQGGGTVTLASLGGGGAGAINAGASAVTLINADNTIQGAGIINGGAGAMTLLNQAGGTIRANTPGGTLELLDTTLTNAGTVQVDAGSILRVINTPFTQTGGKTQVDGLLTATQGELISGGTLLGSGTIAANIVMTRGTMRPGDADAPGTLTIDGDVFQTGSVFDELIGVSGNGLLVVNGADMIGDATNLNIELLGGFRPFSGETFTIMDFLSGSGAFANAPTAGFEMAGFDWTILYGTNSIVLDAVAPVSDGGGGGDGGGGNGGGGTSVPEPSTGVLLLSAIAVAFGGSRLRKRRLTLGI
ncbi:MAG: PEP-CTERM sorting domain-containing protein, partial [Candidatus Acidiferrales bacterium]